MDGLGGLVIPVLPCSAEIFFLCPGKSGEPVPALAPSAAWATISVHATPNECDVHNGWQRPSCQLNPTSYETVNITTTKNRLQEQQWSAAHHHTCHWSSLFVSCSHPRRPYIPSSEIIPRIVWCVWNPIKIIKTQYYWHLLAKSQRMKNIGDPSACWQTSPSAWNKAPTFFKRCEKTTTFAKCIGKLWV